MAKKLSKGEKSIEAFFGKGSCKGMCSCDGSKGSSSRERKLKNRAMKRGK